MVSRSLMIWSLISIVISVIWIVCTYFGYVRYAKMHLYKPSSFVSTYKKLSKAHDDSKVVISFTTTIKKAKDMKPFINSILDQTVQVNQITLAAPPEVIAAIPADLEDYVIPIRIGKDYGEGNCLIPSLLRENEQDTIVIFLRDDQVYNKDLVENLVEKSKQMPDKAITTSCGKATLVKPKFFGVDIADVGDKSCGIKWIKDKLKVPMVTVDGCQIYGSC